MTFLYPPLVGAVIGYITNWLAIKMLFKPHNRLKFLGFNVPFTPGVIPKERDRIASNIGKAVGQHLLTDDVIKRKLRDRKTKEYISKAIIEGLLTESIHIEGLLRRFFRDSYNIKILEIEEWITTHVFEYLNSQTTQDKMIQQMMCYIEQGFSGTPIKKMLPEGYEEIVGSIIEQKAPDMIVFIKRLKDSEVLEYKLKNMIREFIEEKLGSLGAMFVKPESIYNSLMVKIDEQLDAPETEKWLVEQIKQFILNMENKSVNELLTEDGTEKIIQVLRCQVQSLCSKIFSRDEINRAIKPIFNQILSKEIIITQEMKNVLEMNIQEYWEIIIENHISELIQTFNITGIVEEEMKALDILQIEEIILLIVKKELRAITWLGALLGFVMGIVLNFI